MKGEGEEYIPKDKGRIKRLGAGSGYKEVQEVDKLKLRIKEAL